LFFSFWQNKVGYNAMATVKDVRIERIFSVMLSRPILPISCLLAMGALSCLVPRSASAQVTITFDTRGDGTPIVNASVGGGEVVGNDWANLGVLFTPASGHTLNIGNGAASPNALGVDAPGNPNNYSGTLFTTFTVGGGSAVTSSVTIVYDNADSRTIIRDSSSAILLDQFGNSVTFTGTDIASIESRFDFDAIDTITFNTPTIAASAAPEPGSLALLALTGLPIAGAVIRRRRAA
jgi:hypothetical protein